LLLKSILVRGFAAGCVMILAGCGAISKDGPYTDTVNSEAAVTLDAPKGSGEYALINLTPQTVQVANSTTMDLSPAFSTFSDARPSAQALLAVGDVVTLTIFEATTGGLFFPADTNAGASSRQGNYVQVPNQEVDASGYIAAPFAGRIKVAGKTPLQVGTEIERKLADRAIEPQVIVSIADRRSSSISVLGELSGLNQLQRFQIDPSGIDILGAIARAGGPKYPAYETLVTLKRGGAEQQATLTNIITHPTQDVPLVAGDVVYLSHKPRIFLVLGATPSPGSVGGINNRRFNFDDDSETLIEAVAKSGGLDDARADPRWVYLFRLESRATLHSMGVELPGNDALVPTVYTVSMARSDGFFLSNSFLMRNADVIYVPNAPITDLNKFLSVFRNLTGPIYDVGNASANFNTIK
jgi:polysaccharide export outer membrane protein